MLLHGNSQDFYGFSAFFTCKSSIYQIINGLWKLLYWQILHYLRGLTIGIESKAERLSIPRHRDESTLASHAGII